MKILLGMSGGFDSTYAAMKLKNEGYDVEGAVLVMHDYTDTLSAEAAAERVGIPLHIIDCRDAFDNTVRENFVSEYKNGRTPNPCIICNREVKFKYLYEYAVSHGFSRIATGHYAKVERVSSDDSERFFISRARDEKKDQSYMLSRLTQEELSILYLPLSDEIKSELRAGELSESLGISDKKDSQEICFIPDNDYVGYIERHLGSFPEGNFIDESGNVIGTHKGIIRYTIGQRKGLGVSSDSRIFVSRINPSTNEITLSKEGVESSVIKLVDVVFQKLPEPKEAITVKNVQVKVRYAARSVAAAVSFYTDATAEIVFDVPVRSVAPGQTAVIYDGDSVLASGFID